MMKNMGNWSRLEKGNGMGLHQTAADEDTEGEQETGSKTQVTGSRKLDTRHRTQGNIASQTSDKDTQGTQETRNRIQDSGHMIQDTGQWIQDTAQWTVDTVDSGHRARHLNGLGSLLQQIADGGLGLVC